MCPPCTNTYSYDVLPVNYTETGSIINEHLRLRNGSYKVNRELRKGDYSIEEYLNLNQTALMLEDRQAAARILVYAFVNSIEECKLKSRLKEDELSRTIEILREQGAELAPKSVRELDKDMSQDKCNNVAQHIDSLKVYEENKRLNLSIGQLILKQRKVRDDYQLVIDNLNI